MIRLETERLLFRDHEPDDLEPYCEMESDAVYRSPQVVHPRAELERSLRVTWLKVMAMGPLAASAIQCSSSQTGTGVSPIAQLRTSVLHCLI